MHSTSNKTRVRYTEHVNGGGEEVDGGGVYAGRNGRVSSPPQPRRALIHNNLTTPALPQERVR